MVAVVVPGVVAVPAVAPAVEMAEVLAVLEMAVVSALVVGTAVARVASEAMVVSSTTSTSTFGNIPRRLCSRAARFAAATSRRAFLARLSTRAPSNTSPMEA